jgi:hypothetical protein
MLSHGFTRMTRINPDLFLIRVIRVDPWLASLSEPWRFGVLAFIMMSLPYTGRAARQSALARNYLEESS